MKRPIRTASPILRELFEMSERIGVTQIEMAKRSKIYQQQVSSIKAGKYEPGIMTVESLAHSLGYKLTLTMLDDDAISR